MRLAVRVCSANKSSGKTTSRESPSGARFHAPSCSPSLIRRSRRNSASRPVNYFSIIVSLNGGTAVFSAVKGNLTIIRPSAVSTLTRHFTSVLIGTSEYPRYPPSRPPAIGYLITAFVSHSFCLGSYHCQRCPIFVVSVVGAQTERDAET